MGLNVDLCQMLGLPKKVACPRCSATAGRFDDYDIECGDPNPAPGVWELDCYCNNCEYTWTYRVKVALKEE